jgi:two-component system OmpR family response regulator
MSESRQILVVDDEPQIVELLNEILTGNGYTVHSAPDAKGALELVRAQIFDAAILDFNLPDMDGVMLHRRIRQMDEELAERTLFTSGLVQSDSNMGYYSTYGVGFISKPFDYQEILDALANLWHAGAEPR